MSSKPVLYVSEDDPDLLKRYAEQTEQDIAAFEARMRGVEPTYKVGDRVDLYGDIFEIVRYERETGMPGYWIARKGSEDLFIPIDTEERLQPVVH